MGFQAGFGGAMDALRLRHYIDEARARALERCQPVILDVIAEAGVAFAQEFPDAPRGGRSNE